MIESIKALQFRDRWLVCATCPTVLMQIPHFQAQKLRFVPGDSSQAARHVW
jgi:hypothetical protein